MQCESAEQLPVSGLDNDVLSSMIVELVCHYQGHDAQDEQSLDWQSPSRRTRVVCYANRSSLYNVLHQVPDAIAAEYQLYHRGEVVYSWREYRWPHLRSEHATTGGEQQIHIPRNCLDELMRFHVDADTGWLMRYRHRLQRDRGIKINEVGVMAESDCLQ